MTILAEPPPVLLPMIEPAPQPIPADDAPNAALAYAVLDHIEANPESWDQTCWLREAPCGTAGCFAGWTCMLSGDVPRFIARNDPQWRDSDSVISNPEGRLAFTNYRARALLRISRFEAAELFNGGNTLDDLRRLVHQIFGPRPA